MTLLLAATALLAAHTTYAQDAENIYAETGDRVYQILIIDAESKEKAAIGSGFQVPGRGPDGGALLATNFHVVSEAVHDVDKYTIEYLAADGSKGDLELIDFDVVHDLALVAMPVADLPRDDVMASIPVPLSISTLETKQGEQIYSLGNPFDLGQTIVPGTFNGLLEQSFYQKLLFSGSLNPGMSGGPALNSQGEVVGINVATSGNQISFLVPATYLEALLEKYVDRGAALDATGYAEEVARQLFEDQAFKYGLLLEHDWKTQPLGNMRVGADLNEYFKCWGNTNDDEDLSFVSTVKSCTSQDSIYISSRLTTGAIDIQYAWITSDELGGYRFHKVFADNFAFMSTRTRAGEEDVTNYQCFREFVAPNDRANGVTESGAWRAVLCVRQYKDYPLLYDVLYQGSLLGQTAAGAGSEHGQSGLASHFALSGVSKDNALKFAKKFMELHAWDS